MMNEAIKNRYDFVALFDVENGNPNGDPDADNIPRTDPETSIGIVTDVCLKRKIRNFVELYKENEKGYDILIKSDKPLNTKYEDAYDELGLEKGNQSKDANVVKTARDYMCANYYDVRTFGAVMDTGKTWCGSIRGPVQINFAKSIDRVYIQDITITRQAKTTEERQSQNGNTEMGRKSIIPYGLYRVEGYVSANLAQKVTGFSEDDLELLWTAIINMFEHDRSAARGKMCVRKLYIFKHNSKLGNAPANVLFDKIKVNRITENPPRSFNDYEIIVDTNMPNNVELIEKL